jgi:hypothetical protein
VLISDWLIIDGSMDNHVESTVDGAAPDDVADRSDERPGGDSEADQETPSASARCQASRSWA